MSIYNKCLFLNKIECINLGKHNRLFVVVICIQVKYLLTYQLFSLKSIKSSYLKIAVNISVLNCQLCKKNMICLPSKNSHILFRNSHSIDDSAKCVQKCSNQTRNID